MDSPVERSAGVSASSERKWGLIGGLMGLILSSLGGSLLFVRLMALLAA